MHWCEGHTHGIRYLWGNVWREAHQRGHACPGHGKCMYFSCSTKRLDVGLKCLFHVNLACIPNYIHTCIWYYIISEYHRKFDVPCAWHVYDILGILYFVQDAFNSKGITLESVRKMYSANEKIFNKGFSYLFTNNERAVTAAELIASSSEEMLVSTPNQHIEWSVNACAFFHVSLLL